MSSRLERLKISAEIYGLRFRNLLKTLIRLAGLAAVLFGAYLFFQPLLVEGTLVTNEMYLEQSAPSLILIAIGLFVAYKI